MNECRRHDTFIEKINEFQFSMINIININIDKR